MDGSALSIRESLLSEFETWVPAPLSETTALSTKLLNFSALVASLQSLVVPPVEAVPVLAMDANDPAAGCPAAKAGQKALERANLLQTLFPPLPDRVCRVIRIMATRLVRWQAVVEDIFAVEALDATKSALAFNVDVARVCCLLR